MLSAQLASPATRAPAASAGPAARSHSPCRVDPPVMRPSSPRWLGGQSDCGVEDIERRALPAGVGHIERSGPADTELVPRVPAVLPDRPCIAKDEVSIGWPAAALIEVTEVTREYSLELAAVALATGHFCLPGFDQNS